MTYAEAIAYLTSASRFGIKPGLERTNKLLTNLGNPEREMKYLHIAGTNGKGSVAAMAESAIRRAGIRSGLFTSPHLAYYTERMKVSGREITEAQLAGAVDVIRGAAEALAHEKVDPPTEFELCTAMCFEHFRRSGVKLAVMEVGLGGRYDSTNVVVPDASVITHVSYDHMERLGRTLSSIAFDKCGIIKPGVHVISAMQEAEAVAMIRREAEAKGAPLSEPGSGYSFSLARVGLDGTELIYEGRHIRGALRTSLVGVHQAANAAAAVSALESLIDSGWQIGTDDISDGLASAVHPGRFEVFPGEPEVIMDGSHNPDGAQALSETLGIVMGGRKPVALMGFSADKPYARMIELISPRISALIGTGITHTRSGCVAGGYIAEAGRALGLPSFSVEDHAEALGRGIEMARSAGVPLLICGSLYLIGEFRGLVSDRGR